MWALSLTMTLLQYHFILNMMSFNMFHHHVTLKMAIEF